MERVRMILKIIIGIVGFLLFVFCHYSAVKGGEWFDFEIDSYLGLLFIFSMILLEMCIGLITIILIMR